MLFGRFPARRNLPAVAAWAPGFATPAVMAGDGFSPTSAPPAAPAGSCANTPAAIIFLGS